MTRTPSGRRVAAAISSIFVALLVLSSAPPPVRASAATDAESLIVDLINQDRKAIGLRPLRRHSDLAAIAGTRASRMASNNVLNHTIGGDLGAQLDAYDVVWYSYGEAIGYSSRAWADAAARQLYATWMASDPHRALFRSAKFNYIGVGLALRTSNSRTFGAVVLSESLDENGARSWVVDVDIMGDDIRWSWAGADLPLQTHTAGLRDFDVQVRRGDAPWTTIRNDSTATSVTLWNKIRGATYGMRVRATDRRGNVGAWTAESRVTLP